jgi:hypothetical protein
LVFRRRGRFAAPFFPGALVLPTAPRLLVFLGLLPFTGDFFFIPILYIIGREQKD